MVGRARSREQRGHCGRVCERKGVGLGVKRDGQEGVICLMEVNEKKGMLFS